jgi:hypothetical protein
MTIKEMMELVGENKFNKMKLLMKDALIEMELLTNENIVQYTSDIITDEMEYDLPSNMVQLKAVKIKNTDTSKYEPIGRVIERNGIIEE